MATVEEVRDQILAAVNDTKTSLSAALQRVADDVAALQAQVAAGGSVDPAAFDPVLQGISDIKGSLDTLDPVPPTA